LIWNMVDSGFRLVWVAQKIKEGINLVLSY